MSSWWWPGSLWLRRAWVCGSRLWCRCRARCCPRSFGPRTTPWAWEWQCGWRPRARASPSIAFPRTSCRWCGSYRWRSLSTRNKRPTNKRLQINWQTTTLLDQREVMVWDFRDLRSTNSMLLRDFGRVLYLEEVKCFWSLQIYNINLQLTSKDKRMSDLFTQGLTS